MTVTEYCSFCALHIPIVVMLVPPLVRNPIEEKLTVIGFPFTVIPFDATTSFRTDTLAEDVTPEMLTLSPTLVTVTFTPLF